MNKLEPEGLKKYTFLSNILFSEDGEKLGYIVHEPNLDENDYDSNIWIYDIEDDKNYQLTTSNKDKNFIWLNGEEILFVSERGKEKKDKKNDKKEKKETNFFKINVEGGEAKKFDTVYKKVNEIIKKSRTELILSVKEKISEEGILEEENEKDEEKKIEEGKDYHELDEIPYWANGEGFTNKVRTHIYLYDLEEKELRLLVGGPKDVQSFDVGENDISLKAKEYTNHMEIVDHLYHYDIQNDKLRKLTEAELRLGETRFLEDKILFEATDMDKMGINTNMEFYIYDLDKDEYEQVTEMDKSLGNALLTDIQYGSGKTRVVEDDRYYFVSVEDYNVHLNSFTQDDGVRTEIEQDGSLDLFDVCDDHIAYVGIKGLRPQEIYLNGKRITDFNDLNISTSSPEHFIVESNGKKIDSWVMRPVNYEEGKKYPTIYQVHGGPKCAYGEIHFNEFQLLANNGYAILFCNPLGSAGKGNDFADILGQYGREDYDDLMTVLDEAIDKYEFIDEDKLGVAGGSYGGFMTNWIIGHTDRFKAAASFRSISNWVSKFATTDIGYYFVRDQQEATPWDDFEELWDRSPLKYADKVSTPTLFIHSRQDYRCWETEVLQMFTALKYHGVESKLVLFEEENHGLSREGKPLKRVKRLTEILNWFDKYLKK